jgi:hypothetical protein
MFRRIANPTESELQVEYSRMVDEAIENIAADAAEPHIEDQTKSSVPCKQNDAPA